MAEGVAVVRPSNGVWAGALVGPSPIPKRQMMQSKNGMGESNSPILEKLKLLSRTLDFVSPGFILWL
jgi:hypothetical protein